MCLSRLISLLCRASFFSLSREFDWRSEAAKKNRVKFRWIESVLPFWCPLCETQEQEEAKKKHQTVWKIVALYNRKIVSRFVHLRIIMRVENFLFACVLSPRAKREFYNNFYVILLLDFLFACSVFTRSVKIYKKREFIFGYTEIKEEKLHKQGGRTSFLLAQAEVRAMSGFADQIIMLPDGRLRCKFDVDWDGLVRPLRIAGKLHGDAPRRARIKMSNRWGRRDFSLFNFAPIAGRVKRQTVSSFRWMLAGGGRSIYLTRLRLAFCNLSFPRDFWSKPLSRQTTSLSRSFIGQNEAGD